MKYRSQFWAVILVTLLPAFAIAAPQKISLQTSDGNSFPAYVAGSENAKAGVLIVHDWFGVSPFYLETVERLADQGYRVLAVDLYLGKSATTHKDAWALMSALDESQSAARIDAAIGKLQKPGRRIATMAFSMGVPHALQASVRHGDEVSATVLFYGTTIRDTDQLKSLGGPVLSIMGSKDDPEDTIGFEQAMRSIEMPAEIYIYPGAHHAFAQPLFNEGKTYDAAATSISWALAEDFLRRNL